MVLNLLAFVTDVPEEFHERKKRDVKVETLLWNLVFLDTIAQLRNKWKTVKKESEIGNVR